MRILEPTHPSPAAAISLSHVAPRHHVLFDDMLESSSLANRPSARYPCGMPRLRNIQALRFAAAFAVVLFHLTFLYFDVAAMAALSWLRHVGWAGVDIFFVISGFIIYSVTARLDWSAGAPRIAAVFLARRIVRI